MQQSRLPFPSNTRILQISQKPAVERGKVVVVADNDPTLGARIHEHLLELGLETPMRSDFPSIDPFVDMTRAHEKIMDALRLDRKDDSLADTPKRVAKMYRDELFYGLDYNNFPKTTVFENKGEYDELLATTVTLNSFCEHHFLPFIGRAHCAYIPGDKFVGLSKFNRIVDFFARRPQVQERLTKQISAALQLILGTEDVAVVIQAEHYCVKIRGVKDSCGETHTSAMTGKFRTVPELRSEFFSLVNK